MSRKRRKKRGPQASGLGPQVPDRGDPKPEARGPRPEAPPKQAPPKAEAPPQRQRRLILIAVHAYLALQLLLPIGYYAWRRDRYDERFAWRMFSSTRMVDCGTGSRQSAPPAFLVGEARRPADLRATFHTAWLELAQRGRREVIEAMAARVCADNPGQPVRVQYDCRHVDGQVTTESTGGWDICQTGGL